MGFQWRSMAVIKRYTPMTTRAAPQRVNPDDQEFLAFYQEHFASIYRFIYRKVGSQEEAEDLTSQVLGNSCKRGRSTPSFASRTPPRIKAAYSLSALETL